MPAPRYLIPITGQSNVPGRKGVEQITDLVQRALLSAPYPNVRLIDAESQNTDPFQYLYDYGPVPLQPRPFVFPPTPNCSIELSLGHHLDGVDSIFDILKFAVGGTTIAHERGVTCNWPTLPAGGPNFFNQLITRVKSAQQTLKAIVPCVIVMDGESDALNATDAGNYEANYRVWIDEWRRYFPYCAVIFTALSVNSSSAFHATVRAAQEKIAADTPHVFIVNTDDLVLDSGLHYTADSCVTLGYRVGPYVELAVGIQRPPIADFTVQKDGLTVQFTDLSADQNALGTIVKRVWDFGDGTTSTLQNPLKVYAVGGAPTVTLTVMNALGQTATTSQVTTVAIPTWNVDTLARRAWPQTVAEWLAMNVAHLLTDADGNPASGPDDLYNFDEASGAIVDHGAGGKNLAITGSPTYQKPVAGYTRKAVGANGTATSQNANNTTMADISGSPALLVMLVQWNQTATNRPQATIGATTIDEFEVAGGTTHLRKRTGGGQVNGVIAHAGNGVHIIAIAWESGVTDDLFSELEHIGITASAQIGTSLIITFNTTSDAAASSDFLGAALWRGPGARRTPLGIKRMFQAMGFPVTFPT